jgi:hypothetical protein
MAAPQSNQRIEDLIHFYDLLARVEERVGGKRILSQCNGRFDWPTRGVYFFFESGEMRSCSGNGPRVVRVGTHGLKALGRASLWDRLYAHRGTSDGGNHRGSIFRLLVGAAIRARGGFEGVDSWGIASDVSTAARRLKVAKEQIMLRELPLEKAVSAHIGAMPFLWVAVGDDSGPTSERGLIERGSIALLSNFQRAALDQPSANWLGSLSDRKNVQDSGLWNNRHVNEPYDAEFLDLLKRHTITLQ